MYLVSAEGKRRGWPDKEESLSCSTCYEDDMAVEWVQKEHTFVLLRGIVPGRRCCCLAVSIYSTLSCSRFLMGITQGVHLSIKMSQSLSISGSAHPESLPQTSDMFAPQPSFDGLNGEAWMSGCDCRIKWPNFRPHNPAHVNCLVQ